MSVFSKDLKTAQTELKKAKIKKGLYRLFTLGLISFEHITKDAELRYQEAKSATPDLLVWVVAPPNSSAVTVSWVTVLTTSGPVTNI